MSISCESNSSLSNARPMLISFCISSAFYLVSCGELDFPNATVAVDPSTTVQVNASLQNKFVLDGTAISGNATQAQVSSIVSATQNSDTPFAPLSVQDTQISQSVALTFASTNINTVAKSLSASAPTDAPAAIELEDWRTGTAVTVGRTSLDADMPDLSFQDRDIAAEIGNVRVRGVRESITLSGFEFGAISFKANGLSISGNDLHQVLVGAKPAGRWRTYPFADTFNPATDVTIPPAFKVRIIGESGRTLQILQMQDGKPINDSSLSQDRKDPSTPLRPFFNIGMLLPWSSEMARPSAKAKSHFPGFASHPESRAKVQYAANGSFPMVGVGVEGRQQMNGFNNWHAMAKWPLSWGSTRDVTLDKFGYDVSPQGAEGGPMGKSAWIGGWGYEPGSISGHDWFTGPGGVRFDRAVIPAPLAYFTSNPNYKRPKDNTDIRELVENWGYGYFNHSGHYLTDVKKFSTILNSENERNTASQMNAYYGGGRTFAPLSQSIDIRAVTNGSYNLVGNNGGTDPASLLDNQGRRFWNGWALDDNHLHQTPYWQTILLNSPMHIVASRAAYNQSYLARLGSKNISMRPTNNWGTGPSYASVNSRVQAYRWMHYTMMWKSATDHPLGVSRMSVENAFLDDLRKFHDTIVLPTQTETQNPYHVAINKLGIPVFAWQDSQGKWFLKSEATGLQYYHATLFVTLKSLGLWNTLLRDPKAKASLEFVMEAMSKFSMNLINETDGRAESEDGQVIVAGPFNRFEDISASSVPNSWRDWAVAFPAKGQENWSKNATGQFIERYSGQHLRAQWAFVMRDWFPEYGRDRAITASSNYMSYFAQWQKNVESKPNPTEQRNADFAFQPISHWIINPPAP
jgi:hypothetical protein